MHFSSPTKYLCACSLLRRPVTRSVIDQVRNGGKSQLYFLMSELLLRRPGLVFQLLQVTFADGPSQN